MSVETYAPLSLILKFQRFLHEGCWNSKWKANFNLVWTLWGIDRLGVLRKMKQMHHDFVVKVREVNAGDMSCLLGSATGLLQRLWLVLSSLGHLGKKDIIFCLISVLGQQTYGVSLAGGKREKSHEIMGPWAMWWPLPELGWKSERENT